MLPTFLGSFETWELVARPEESRVVGVEFWDGAVRHVPTADAPSLDARVKGT